jgi:hypothetical protein
MPDIQSIHDRTLKYLEVKRGRSKTMAEQTLIRIATSNAEALERECENLDQFYGVVQAINHTLVTISLYDQLANQSNTHVKELYGFEVALLGELFLTESGKELLTQYG